MATGTGVRTGRRLPALDGLRGLAVLAVMAFHTSPHAHGGFLGVDVFFVVSGYLITALLLAEHARTGRIDLRAFYLRRALRLGPALLLLLVLGAVLVAGPLRSSLTVPPWLAFGSVVAYVANWTAVAVGPGLGPLTHTWSLAIEEQFYLVWPLVLGAVLRRTARIGTDAGRPPDAARPARSDSAVPAWLVPALAAAALAVAALRGVLGETGTAGSADWTYYATVTHSDGLLLGALLAVVLQRRAGRALAADRTSSVAAAVGLAGLAVLMATAWLDAPFTDVAAIALAGICTAFVVHAVATGAAGAGAVVPRVLRLRPLVAVGTVSYGLYLFHFPVFMVVQPYHLGHVGQITVELGVTAAVTLASWFGVERPALRLKARLGRVHGVPAPAPDPAADPAPA